MFDDSRRESFVLYHLQPGDVYISDDCSTRTECTADGEIKEGNYQTCADNAECVTKNNVKACYCKDGFTGDGTAACASKSL